MQKPRFLAAAALAATIFTAACNSEPEIITANTHDPQADALAKAPPRELPPAIQSTRTYRCRDNSLLYADFYTNNTVRARINDRSAAPTVLTAEEGNPPYTAEGWSISANAEQVTLTAPGRGTQTCRAG
jgi:hypothetical protein